MKKVLLLVAAFAAFTSCSTDDVLSIYKCNEKLKGRITVYELDYGLNDEDPVVYAEIRFARTLTPCQRENLVQTDFELRLGSSNGPIIEPIGSTNGNRVYFLTRNVEYVASILCRLEYIDGYSETIKKRDYIYNVTIY